MEINVYKKCIVFTEFYMVGYLSEPIPTPYSAIVITILLLDLVIVGAIVNIQFVHLYIAS